ncbi:MAG TPA: hypothetical protein VN380_15535 [Thermoanaerobaculia bacterium]|jgi:hypothetical protein|nr:hypothetical protein [Thermoanaerobaculia bacterium]
MRYLNRDSGLQIDLSHLDRDRKRFYQSAIEKLDENVPWLEFEDFAFSFGSPVFRTSRNRQEVLSDPLYVVLKDIWLRLGIRQGLVAPSKESVTSAKTTSKGRQANPHLAAHRGHLEIADKPSLPRRRSR